MAAFRNNALDITFIGITADRAEVMQYGPTVIDLQTTYVVPAGSKIASIEEIDQPGLRILVPQRSAQEAHLRKTNTKTTPINVAVENPKQAVELIAAGQADAFSREVPMLASTQPSLPGSRVLPRSYFSVPVAVAEAKASGFVQQAIERAGVPDVVVAAPR
jgi:polar amino acid transport system substrate-binding protein